MDTFYVVLPSNSSITGKTSNFTVRLPETLVLDGNWTVALSSLIYPISFTSLGSQENQYIIVNKKDNTKETIPIPAMNFHSISNLEKGINDAVLLHYQEGQSRFRRSAVKDKTPEKEDSAEDRTPEREAERDKSPERESDNIPQRDVQLSEEDKRKLEAANRAIEKAFNEIKRLGAEAADITRNAHGVRHKGEHWRRKYPAVAQVKNNLLVDIVNRIQSNAEAIDDEFKIVGDIKKDLVEFNKQGNVLEARKSADRAKQSENKSKEFRSEISRLYYGTQENNYQDGAFELANQIQTTVEEAMEPPREALVRPPTPPYPPGHPKLKEQEKQKEQEEKETEKVQPIEEPPEVVEQVNILKEKKEKEIINEPVEESQEIIEELNRLKDAKKDREKEPKLEEVPKSEEKEPEIEVDRDKSPEREIVELPKKETSVEEKEIKTLPVLEGDDEIIYLSSNKVKEKLKPKIPSILADQPEETYTIKPPEKPKIKGFYIEENDEDQILSLKDLPSLPAALPLVSNEEQRDMSVPEKVHSNLMGQLNKKKQRGKALNDLQKVEFRYDKIYQKFVIVLNKDIRSIDISNELAYILGFQHAFFLETNSIATYMPDLSAGIKQMYIYAPKLVENSIVGNSSVPLLRIVNIEGEPGQIVEGIYINPFFHRLKSNRISEITIETRTPAGELINFHWGVLTLTLVFKRSFF